MDDFKICLEREIENNNFNLLGNINYGSLKFQRFKDRRRPTKGKDLFVVLWGDYGASFGDWRNSSSWKNYFHNGIKYSSKEQKTIKSKIFKKVKEEKKQEESIILLELIKFIQSPNLKEPAETHLYILKKRIKPIYCSQYNDEIIIPIYSSTGSLQTIQSIKPNGFKKFYSGLSPLNGYLILGETITDPIWICEGWATGCTIYEALIGESVIVSFSAENLKNVCKIFREKYPFRPINICSDDDSHLDKNIGLESAIYCKNNYGSIIKLPDFSHCDLSEKPTDFNDLFCQKGIEEVERQLRS
jgi:putative DNA primase/helicase